MDKRKPVAVLTLIAFAALAVVLFVGCASDSWKIEKSDGVDVNVTPDSLAMVPLDVAVDGSDSEWWFYDNFTFVGRISSVGNILLVAKIGRCLDPDADRKVTKTFECKFFDGVKWISMGSYSQPDIIEEMKTMSANQRMQLRWLDPLKSGVLNYMTMNRGMLIFDFRDLVPYYSLESDGRFKRTYAAGQGALQIGDSVWMGHAFYEMINIRENNQCKEKLPDFNPENSFRVFARTSAGKTIVAYVDGDNTGDQTTNAFFTILNGNTYSTADGYGRIKNSNADFRLVRDLMLPHYVEVFSGDSINVRLDLWMDKDVWHISDDGTAMTGAFGNAVFWNRREKVWALIEHYQRPEMDTLVLMGDVK